ncbi:MAG: methyltransferase domain-containing protein [Planctomycetaceae bacterium]
MGTKQVKVFDDSGNDTGFLQNHQNWWFDPQFPHAFDLFDLDSFYEENYFKTDHVSSRVVRLYVDAVLDYGQRLNQAQVSSVFEAGCGGGWFTKEFMDRGVDVLAIEGTQAGLAKAVERGVPPERLIRHDLRRPLHLGRRFSIATCTEVAEHLECPFAGQLVQTLVNHSDVVWFTFEPPGTNDAHYHHCNEQPPKFWTNLFAFHDYRAIEIPAELRSQLKSRGWYIFCSPRVNIPTDLSWTRTETGSSASLGGTNGKTRRDRYWIKKFTPPIVLDFARILLNQK